MPVTVNERLKNNPLRNRDDLRRLLEDMVEPLYDHFSPGRARVELAANRASYGDPASALEGYSRPLWGLAPLAAGGGKFAHWDLWREGLVNGTDPKHPEYWGLAGDFDQRSVEQGAFGFALALAPNELWKPLTSAQRANLVAWLRRIHEVKLVRSNWLFFRVLVQLGLHQVGETWDEKVLDSDLSQIESFYLRDGWSTDGPEGAPWRDGRTGDYYVPMAIHFYGLVYARLASSADPARSARIVERARLFAREFQHYFAADGSALPFGRSLAYRFAQGAFWGGLAYAGVEALPWPVIKGIYLRHLRWWMRQPIFTETGLLTIGYAYPNLLMAESYNSPGSPYWALKAFLPLALPDSHPFWRAEEAPLPPRRAALTSPGSRLVLTTDPRSRDVVALAPGQRVLDWPRNAPHKYSKFTYGNRFGFAVTSGASIPAEGGLDGELSLSDDERYFRRRDFAHPTEVREGAACSLWKPWPDVEVRTWLVAAPEGHVRLHHVKSARALWTLEAGFAVPYFTKSHLRQQPDLPGGPVVRSPRGSSTVRELLGGRTAACVELGANTHILASLSAMPVLRGAHQPGEFWLASWVDGTADENAPLSGGSAFSVGLEGEACVIRRDGRPWWTVSNENLFGQSSPERLRALDELV